jgi:hypothetical protein
MQALSMTLHAWSWSLTPNARCIQNAIFEQLCKVKNKQNGFAMQKN